MAFKLYNAPQSTCSQRVRFVFNGKKIPFDEVKLNLLAGDQLKPDYLKLNPNGVVPTLDHDGAIVIDSTVITEYLDEVCTGEELHAGIAGRARPHARADAFHRRNAGRRRARADFQSRLPAQFPEDEPRAIRGHGREQAAAPRIHDDHGPDRLFQGRNGRSARAPAPRLRAHGRRDRKERRPLAARQGHQPGRRRGDAGAGAHARPQPAGLAGPAARRHLVRQYPRPPGLCADLIIPARC